MLVKTLIKYCRDIKIEQKCIRFYIWSYVMKIFSIKRRIFATTVMIMGKKFVLERNTSKIVQKNYASVIRRLQAKFGKQKIKVGFLINEQAKWQYQSLYEDMEISPYFEPIVLVTKLVPESRDKKDFHKSLEACYDFFKHKNMNVRCVYDVEKSRYFSAKELGVDILFYQQPWYIHDAQHPINVSKYALTCYVPYGMHLIRFFASYIHEFHHLLWKMFVEHEDVIAYLQSVSSDKVTNCAVVGYSKLDVYLEKDKPVANDKITLIYAPHHSFEKDGLSCATFEQNGMDILRMARKYKDKINWIFKPHPRFKHAVISNKIMTEAEMENYYAEWRKFAVIYDSGDYFDIFKKSSGLITDCVSFLGEYLPSGHPVFHLLSAGGNFNDFAQSIIDTYYKIHNMLELEDALQKVIFEGKDTLKEKRLAQVAKILDKKEKTSTRIIRNLTSALAKKK